MKENTAELIRLIGMTYLMFGLLLYLPENKAIKRVLRFGFSVLLISVLLQGLLP